MSESVTSRVKCGNVLSPRAGACASCGYPAPWNLGKCRVCGEVLPIEQYRQTKTVTSTYIVEGTSRSRSSDQVFHVACPKCGDPEPLVDAPLTPAENARANAAIATGCFALILVGLFVWWMVSWQRSNDREMREWRCEHSGVCK